MSSQRSCGGKVRGVIEEGLRALQRQMQALKRVLEATRDPKEDRFFKAISRIRKDLILKSPYY